MLSYSPSKGLIKIHESTDKLINLSEVLKDRNYLSFSYLQLGNCLYNAGSYARAATCLEKAWKSMDLSFDEKYRAAPLRRFALCMAYLGRPDDYYFFKKLLLAQLPGLSYDLACMNLEGLARAEAILGNRDSYYKLLNKAKYYLGKDNKYKVMRTIQLVRTELESEVLFNDKRHTSYLQKISKKGLLLAKEYGYKMHGKKIERVLKVSNILK